MSELLIKGGMVYSYIDEGFHAIKLQMADVYIKDGFISEVAPGIAYSCDTLDASDCVVFPGMINMGGSTFAARISSGLLADRRDGMDLVAPLLSLACRMLPGDELRSISMAGLWETVAGGATTVAELFREANRSLIPAMQEAADMLGVRFFAVTEDEIKAAGAIIGTGCVNSCMITEMRATAFAVKHAARDAGACKASDVFYSATVVNGRVLDAEKFGRIGCGFNADLSVVCLKRFAPLSYPLSQYVYGANASDVRHVVACGKPVKRNYKPAGHIKPALSRAQKEAEKAIKKLWEEARREIL